MTPAHRPSRRTFLAGAAGAFGIAAVALQEVRARGIPVVISTRVHSGRTLALYAGNGSGVTLERASNPDFLRALFAR